MFLASSDLSRLDTQPQIEKKSHNKAPYLLTFELFFIACTLSWDLYVDTIFLIAAFLGNFFVLRPLSLTNAFGDSVVMQFVLIIVGVLALLTLNLLVYSVTALDTQDR